MTAFTRSALALTGLAALALAPAAHAQAGTTTLSFDNLTAQAQASGYGFADLGPSNTAQGYTFAAVSPNAFIPPAVPEASTTVSFGLLLALGMGGWVLVARRKKVRA